MAPFLINTFSLHTCELFIYQITFNKEVISSFSCIFFLYINFPIKPLPHPLCIAQFFRSIGTPEANTAINSLRTIPISGYFSRISALTTGVKSLYNYILINPFIFDFNFWQSSGSIGKGL